MTRLSPHSRPTRLLKKIFTFFIVSADAALVIFADLAAFTLRFGTDIAHPPPKNFFAYFEIATFIIILRLICFYVFGFYHSLRSKTNFEIVTNTLRATSASTIIIIVIAFYFRTFAYPRTVILISWALTTAFLTLWHIVIQAVLSFIFQELRISFLVIGTDKEAQRIGLHISKDAMTKNRLVGYVRLLSESQGDDSIDTSRVLGGLNDLEEIIKRHGVNEVIIATNKLSALELSRISRTVTGRDVTLKLLPGIYEAVIGNIITSPVSASNTLSSIMVSPVQTTYHWYRGLKRIIDLIISTVVLAVFWPIMILIAILIKVTSPGLVLYKQERVGLHGKRFTIYKFRTMHQNAEEESGPVWASIDDPRITPLGKFLRLTRLDELPQLINVIKNEMSLVGPRPERPFFVEELMKEIPFYVERLSVKPGITGWAQVAYKYAGTIEENREKLLNDIFYIKNMSFFLDLWILFKTVWTIIQEKGAQ